MIYTIPMGGGNSMENCVVCYTNFKSYTVHSFDLSMESAPIPSYVKYLIQGAIICYQIQCEL